MFVVRSDQMKVFKDAAKADFVERMVAHIYEDFDDMVVGLSLYEVREYVAAWTDGALSYGLEKEIHAEAFIELCVCHEELDREPLPTALREILTFPDRPAEDKLSRLKNSLLTVPLAGGLA